MKKLKILLSLLVLVSVLFFTVSPVLANNNVEPNGEKDIPALFSHEVEM